MSLAAKASQKRLGLIGEVGFLDLVIVTWRRFSFPEVGLSGHGNPRCHGFSWRGMRRRSGHAW